MSEVVAASKEIRYLDDAIVDLVDAYPQVAAYRAGALRDAAHPVASRLIHQHASLEQVAATIGRTELYKRGKDVRGSAHAVSAALTTDDFADVLTESVRRIMSHAYDAQADHRALVAPVAATDYTPQSFPEIDVSDDLDRAFENEEPSVTGITTTTGESASMKTWARVLAVTRRVILGDREQAFEILARRLGDAASRNEASEIYTTIENNPALSDGANLWSGEAIVTGQGTLNDAALAAGMAALRNQTTVGGHKGNFTARHLVVPTEDEHTALKLARDITVGNSPRLRVVASPWLTSGSFYLLADPNVAPGLGMLTFAGSERSFDVSRGFDRMNRRQMIAIHQDMAVTPLSRRGGVKVTA